MEEDFGPGCFQVLAATENATNQWPLFMQLLAQYGKLSMAKALCPLLSNPNGDDEEKKTPIYLASRHGQLEIIKFLEPISDNLTANAIQLAIQKARLYDHDHVVKYLNSLLESKQ